MNLREVRKKIKSVNNVKKITKAMQLISSVKMKKAQSVALEGRPYRENLEKMIRRVSGAGEMKESKFVNPKNGNAKKDLILYISANKGMCGAFLTSLSRHILKHVDYDTTDFITVGNRGATFLAITKGKVTADFSSLHPLNDVGAMFKLIKDSFFEGEYRNVYVLYNKFINTLRYDTVQEQILPVRLEEFTEEKTESKHETNHSKKAEDTYTIEPMSTEIVDALLESYVEEKIRGALLNSEASEHSARMIAMKNATENAADVIYNLTLEGNKLRQEKITSELLDMITAKESVEGD